MHDPFDDLLKEAKRFRYLERARELGKAAALKTQVQVQVIAPRPLRQLESPGWYEARTILIVKEQSDHTLVPLGVYIEHLHPAYGRHLVPCPSLDQGQSTEKVTSWGDGRPRPPPYIESDEEITQIRNRFESLLAEVEEDERDER